MRAKREQEQNCNYRYYDTIHREYIDVPDELRPILDSMCASKYWTEIASILSDDEMTLLLEIFVMGYDFAQVSMLNSASYAAVASKKHRLLVKLRKFFESCAGNDADSVYAHYFD